MAVRNYLVYAGAALELTPLAFGSQVEAVEALWLSQFLAGHSLFLGLSLLALGRLFLTSFIDLF